MRCEETEDRLNLVLDRRQDVESDTELWTHCESCPECRQLLASYAAMLDGFHTLVTPAAPDDMSLRVMACLETSAMPVRRWALIAATLLATAAGLWFVTVPLIRDNRPNGVQPGQTVAKLTAGRAMSGTLPRRTISRNELSRLPIVPEIMSMASGRGPDSYKNLARETGEGLAVVVLNVPGWGGNPMASVRFNEPAWAAEIGNDLKPVADSVSEALQLLLRSFPAGGDTSS